MKSRAMPSRAMTSRAPVLGMIFLAAMLSRTACILNRPDDLATDPDAYVAHAQMIQQGKGFVVPGTDKPTAFRPPGYPFMIAMMPGSTSSPERAIAMLHIAAGILTVLLTRQLAEEVGLSTMSGNLAALLVALDPLLIRYSALPMTEVVSALTLTGGMVLWIQFRNRLHLRSAADGEISSGTQENSTSRRTGWLGFLAGIVLGFSSLVRPIGLVVMAFLSSELLTSLALAPQEKRSLRSGNLFVRMLKFVSPCTVSSAGFLLAISPWVTRNFVEFQTFIPATTHGGYTLALGNNPDYYRDVINGDATKPWDGEKLDQWQKRMASEARAAGIAIGDEKATDTWMYSQAFQAIQSQPANFVRASWLRIRTFWAISPTGAVSDVQRLLSSIWYAGLWFAIIGLILVRLTCRIAKRMPFFSTKSAPIWLTVLAFQLMHTFYWTDARMRAPLMPALAVLVALAFRWTHAFFTGPLTKGAVNDLYLCDTGIPDSGTGRSAERVTSV